MGVPEDDSNLRRSQTLLSQLEDLLLDFIAGHFHPLRDRATIGQSGLGNTLSWSVHTTHDGDLLKRPT